MTDFTAEREAMVERQLKRRGIHDQRILKAFLAVPREAFVSADLAHLAYRDHPLPIAAGQTISQPFIVAEMIQEAGITPGDKVLEIGAGSGYAAAVIGQIADEVVAIERHRELVELASGRMARLGFGNIRIIEGDGSRGCPDEAPFDAIVASASGSHVPQELLDQLKPGGHIVMPLGDPGAAQELVKITKRADGSLDRENLGGVRFVPLIGARGHADTNGA